MVNEDKKFDENVFLGVDMIGLDPEIDPNLYFKDFPESLKLRGFNRVVSFSYYGFDSTLGNNLYEVTYANVRGSENA